MHRNDSTERRRWTLALLLLATALLFLVLHPYRGLVHDARLYTLQALGHLHPDLYAGDIFLRFGSQDNYTLFSPLYAWIISWVGVEPAAAGLTLAAIFLFMTAAWMVARSLLPAEQAACALLLIVLVPPYYGSERVFHYLEGFVTPRQLAEALALFGLAAWLNGRRILGASLSGAAMLFHPIIGLVGLLLLPALEWITPHWRRLWPLSILVTLVTALAILGWLPLSRWQFDQQWYEIVLNRTYLALSHWNNEDWGRVLTVISTLLIAGITLRDKLQRVAKAAFITTCSLMLLAGIGGDLLRLVIVVQAQTWRALWLATILALILIPPLYARGWNGTALMRCALLLLTAAWAVPHGILSLVAAPLSVVCAYFASHTLPRRSEKLLIGGSWAMLCVSLAHSLAVLWLALNENLSVLDSLPPFMQKLTLLGDNGVLPALVVVTCGFLVTRFSSRGVTRGFAILTMVAVIAAFAPFTRTWTVEQYDAVLVDSFSNWRARIPAGSEVLWVDSELETAATNTWLLLQRPSYMSITQAPNALFSREAALKMAQRSKTLSGLMPFADPFSSGVASNGERVSELKALCQALSVRYIVTSETFSDAIPIPAPHTARSPLRDNNLYSCT